MSGLTFAHVSDLHLPFEPRLTPTQRLSKRQLSVLSWRRRRALHRSDILESLVRDLRAEAVDHVLVTGDIVNFSLPDEFRRAAAWLAALGPAERVSLVPGNHDALVPVPAAEGLDLWQPWTRLEAGWPFVHRVGAVTVIGLASAVPTAPLLARGALGDSQLARLERVLVEEGAARRVRVVLLHHPPADGVVGWRKALADRGALREVLRRAGAELVLHGHARDARLDAVPGPRGPIPCLGVPSSSAAPSRHDEGARWHRLRLRNDADDPRVEVAVRRWSPAAQAFQAEGRYELCLPRPEPVAPSHNLALWGMGAAMANATEIKFGDPATRIAQTDHWSVLLRPKQPTLGSLVLVCREPVLALAEVSAAAYADLRTVVRRVEAVLGEVVAYERINYLMLMMVDRDVHFHVIPRHAGSRRFGDVEIADAGWPGAPALEPATTLGEATREALLARLRDAWSRCAA